MIAGRQAINPGDISLDADFARDLGVTIGDSIRISVFGSELDLRVV
jgi:predicted lysophospholipase L1 biosynthesis ABC-type transport system permease subunit